MATRTIGTYTVVTDYTNATETTLAGTLTGKPYGFSIIYNTDLGVTRIWNGSAFVNAPTVGGSGDMLAANNLSELVNKATSRTNLGIDTTVNQTDTSNKRFLTDAQQSKLNNILSSDVALSKIGTPTYNELQKIHNLTRSTGHLSGGDITDAGGGNINISAGQGFIRATSDDTSTLFSFDWAALNGQPITDNSIRYIVANYHATTPFLSVETTDNSDYRTIFIIGIVVREGGVILINNVPHNVGRIAGRISRRNYEVEDRSRAHKLGGLIISETGTRNLSVTAGVTWYRAIRDVFAGLDTNVTGSFTRAYRDGASGWTFETAQTQLPINQYDNNSGTLQTIGNNNYAVYWVYLSGQGNILMVYGRLNNNSLSAAQAEEIPTTVPLRLQIGSLLLGRMIYRRSGGTTALQVTETAFGTMFSSGVSNTHNGLAGIQGGTIDEYYHLTNAQAVVVSNTSGTNTGDQTISDATITTTDITTNNFTTSKHGFVPKGTNVGNYLKDDGTWSAIAGGGDMVLASTQTNSGAKTFLNATLLLRNIANTFSSLFSNVNTAARTYTLKDADGTIAFVSDLPQFISGTAVIDFGFVNEEEETFITAVVANVLITNANIKNYSFIFTANADHDVDDFSVEEMNFSINNIIDNTSFEISAYAPLGSWGQYSLKYLITI